MKKNENKGLIKIIVVLIALIAIGNILSYRGSAKEMSKVKEEPKAKTVSVAVCLTEENELNWGDAVNKILETLQEDYKNIELIETYYDTNEINCNAMRMTYETEDGIVTGWIYDRR